MVEVSLGVAKRIALAGIALSDLEAYAKIPAAEPLAKVELQRDVPDAGNGLGLLEDDRAARYRQRLANAKIPFSKSTSS